MQERAAGVDATLLAGAEHERDNPRGSVVGAIASLDLRPGLRITDVGCGPGAHLGLLATSVVPDGVVVGIDISNERLAVAQALNQELIARGSVQLQQGDADQLPYEAEAFDVTWSSLVLHHSARQREFVAELARVTRRGGLVAIMEGDNDGSFPLMPWPPELELRLRAAMLRGEQERYGGRLEYTFTNTGRHLTRLFREAGLVNVQLRAYADVDRAPLDAVREQEVRSWVLESFGPRVRPYLAQVDWEYLVNVFTAGSADDLLASPDFFQSRTWFLAVGRVA